MAIDWSVVDNILEEVDFYVDRFDRYTLYAQYKKEKECLEFFPVDSREFEACLRVWYRHSSGERDVPSVKPIIQYIQDEAIYFESMDVVEPHARVAGNIKDGLEYFMADSSRRVVRIADGKWSFSTEPQFKFLSTKAFDSQVEAKRSKENLIDLLQPLVNLRGDDLLLFAIWLVQAFSCGSHYGIMLSAERGSGKSSLTRTINKIVDPSEVDTTLMQRKLEDFQNYLANHYLVCFDNVREIPKEYSDTLCAAITGTTVAKRQLFKDRDEVLLKLHNIVVMNGIGIFPKESDLAERFLLFELKKIKPENAISEYDLKRLMVRNRPLILGCIFDILAKTTQIIGTINPKKPTRLVDAYTEMLAIAIGMGISEQEFHRLIMQNIAKVEAMSQGSPVVQAVSEYMNGPMRGTRKVVKSSTKFFEEVRDHYSGNQADLPCRAAEFSKTLKAECAVLMKAGFGCLVDDTGVNGSFITVIRYKN